MTIFKEYQEYDALGLAELVKKKQLSAQELAETAQTLSAEYNPQLNAIIHDIDPKSQLEQLNLDAPLAGVPFLLKESASVTNTPSTSACALLKNFRLDHDSELVKRYRNTGLIFLGKTNLPELGLSSTTESAFYGPCHNPWGLQHSTGGSSGGSAAAVAAGIVPAAHGSDGGGSLRIPASCCGLFTLKPTRGRTPSGPDLGKVWQGHVVEHVITRSVRDSAAILDFTHGADPGAPFVLPEPSMSYLKAIEMPSKPLRIAFTLKHWFGGKIHPDCIQAVKYALNLCEKLGHHIEEVDIPFSADTYKRSVAVFTAAEISAALTKMMALLKMPLDPKQLEPSTRLLLRLGQYFRAQDFSQASFFFDHITRQIGQFFTQYDILVTPTLASPPPRLGTLLPTERENAFASLAYHLPLPALLDNITERMMTKLFDFIPHTMLFNTTGNPAASIPLYWNQDNLPIGVQFVGRFAEEDMLLQLAKQLEEINPWFHNTPYLKSNSH